MSGVINPSALSPAAPRRVSCWSRHPGGQHLEPWRAARVRKTSDTKRSPIARDSFEIIIKHGDAFPRDVIGRGTSSQLPWLSACLAPHSSIISRSLRFVSAASSSAGHGGTERHSGTVISTRSNRLTLEHSRTVANIVCGPNPSSTRSN